MKASIKGYLKKHKNGTIQDVLNEAIINSIQANAKNIEVKISSGGLDNNIIEEIQIVDDGDGFTEKNREAFCELHTLNKEELGCKGVGRFFYLKVFNKVQFESFDGVDRVSFDFNENFTKDNLKPKTFPDVINKGTHITLNSIHQNISNSYKEDKIYNDTLQHIYPYLFLSKNTVGIKINNKPLTMNYDNIKTHNFKIKNEEFKLHYEFKKDQNDKKLEAFICFNNRPTTDFSAQPLKIQITTPEKSHIMLLLQSKWIDNQSNENHKFTYIEDDESNENINGFNWNDVRQEVNVILKDIFKIEYPKLEEESKTNIQKLKTKYLHYAEFIENNGIGAVNEKQILDNAYKKAREQEERVLKNDNPNEEDIKKCMQTSLIGYILHRQKVIDKLILLKNTSIENEIHKLFLGKGLEGTEERQVPIEQNNLWLLDDKFMSYSYVASEKTITTFLKNNKLSYSKSTQEMDIIHYFTDKDKNKACIIELKKLTANYKENGVGINQLFNYSKKLFESGVKELYLYLFAEIDNDFRDALENKEGFKKIFSQQGEIWQNSYQDRNSYIQIISPNAIIADANARNKTFLDIIKKQKNIIT